MNRFVFTCGDVNGIGPEIVLKALNKISTNEDSELIFICPKNVFEFTAASVPPLFNFEFVKSLSEKPSSTVKIIPLKNVKQSIGIPTRKSGKTAFNSIRKAFELTIDSTVNGMITAPISKTALNLAGIRYPGHTEMIASWCGTKNYAMMFLSDKMNAALVTIHEPLRRISKLLTKKLVSSKIDIAVQALQKDLNITNPKIAILGLNPHAGEVGIIGREEIEIIEPVIKKHKYSKYLDGPFSSDAFFANKLYEQFDLIIAMYHDQGLIPFKLLNFSSGVNYTAGLPIVRTSPDHGTAYDIAGKNSADESSLLQAFNYAKKIVHNRMLNEIETRK